MPAIVRIYKYLSAKYPKKNAKKWRENLVEWVLVGRIGQEIRIR